MKHKRILTCLFSFTFLIFTYQVIWGQDSNTDEDKRFDLDQNGELSQSEKELMVRVVRIENERGVQFSVDEIRNLQNGRGEQPRRRGGNRRGGSREPAGPRLNPEQVEFKDGAATIPDRETFKKLSYQGREVRIDTQLIGLEFVKFQIERTDTEDPQLYFMNTETHRSHGSFMSAAGLRRGQGQKRGVLVYRPLSLAPNGEPGVYTFEFNPNDAFPFAEIKAVHNLLIEKMPILENRLGYCPLWGAINLYRNEKALYDKAEFPVYFEDDLYANIGFLPLNSAESFGRLQLLDEIERPSPRDIVICKTLPNEMSRVAGIITGVRQTPLSHVNLRAIQDKVPNAFISEAWKTESIASLIGKYVYYKVSHDGFEIREATQNEVEKHFSNLRPTKIQKPIRDLSVKQIQKLEDIEFTDSSIFGVKTANVATLRTFDFPDGIVPNGFGLSFHFYDEFMKHNDLYERIDRLLNDVDFQKSLEVKKKELKKLRDEIKKAEVPEWMMDSLSVLQNSFPKDTPLRCRSSTNNEDLPNFSGAGLYDSFTHHPEEGHLSKSIKQVYASLWNYRAFEARDFYRIDHFTTAMGVLVHPNYENELANGVAVSDDVVYQTDGNYYFNTQVGEEMVTNPNETAIPEEILVDWWDSSNYRIVKESNLANSKRILTDKNLSQLTYYLGAIHNKFNKLYNSTTMNNHFAMEIEYKIMGDGKIIIKQARPWIQ
ncbi:hypothetical protein JT359_03700 [Candidatus Poribacteria bacterium]|nr:hypothetical protein [Candidatus Poribacteria bacterium]